LSLLALIWWLSVALAVLALLVMALLVVLRLLTARRERKWAARRRQLVHRLLGGELTPADELERLPSDLVADTFVELIRLVRGGERDAFVLQAAGLGVPRHLARRLRLGSARERLLAAQSLGQFPGEDTGALLQGALADRNPQVRLAAALSLAETGHCEDIGELVGKLGLGSAEASTLAVTLFRSLSAERLDEIKGLVTAPGVPVTVRIAAIEALATTGDYSLVPAITQLAIHAPDDSVELPAYLRALGLFAHPAARPAVLDGLGRRSLAARAAAAGAAGRIGLVEFAGRLALMLDDREWWVRFRAAEALLRLGAPGVQCLRKQAREGSPRARTAAASMLAEHHLAP
jgi:HEAT repeat protein